MTRWMHRMGNMPMPESVIEKEAEKDVQVLIRDAARLLGGIYPDLMHNIDAAIDGCERDEWVPSPFGREVLTAVGEIGAAALKHPLHDTSRDTAHASLIYRRVIDKWAETTRRWDETAGRPASDDLSDE